MSLLLKYPQPHLIVVSARKLSLIRRIVAEHVNPSQFDELVGRMEGLSSHPFILVTDAASSTSKLSLKRILVEQKRLEVYDMFAQKEKERGNPVREREF